ncbi:hypothetical protein OK074_1480 [Actinobacteria bacterium OK074]|nr:hypothetical protein OK074_1480 [Actinobacteria bacterium OK074]
MSRNGRTTKRLWRLRSNPLRRRDDVVEAWIVLAVWVVVAVGGTLAGLVTSHAADEVFAGQRAERHTVRAVLLTDTPSPTPAIGGTQNLIKARVRWTAADGTRRTGSTLVDTGQKAGSTVVIWLNTAGAPTAAPPSATEAGVESAFLGLTAALALTGTAFGAGAAARYRLDRRRIDAWGTEWNLVGPSWGHRTG